jgi:Protein of unknown function (DUF3309)
MSTILFIVLIVLLLGALPPWPYSANWGVLSQRFAGSGASNCSGHAFDWTSAYLIDVQTARIEVVV